MKKLLQINVAANVGSTGKIAEQIGSLVQENGWKAYIAYGRNENKSELNAIRIGSEQDNNWHAIQTRLFDNHGLVSKSATRRFVEQIKEIKPDIVHLHNIHGYYLNYPILFNYLKEWGGPVVWTLHDIWPFTGHCAYFGVDECQKWKTGCHNCPHKNTYPKSILLDRSRSNYLLKKSIFTSLENLTLIPVSNWLSRLLDDSFLAQYPRITIHNGIDTNIFTPGGKIKDPYILGVAMLWDKRKGLDDFIKLRALIPEGIGIKLVGLSKNQIEKLPNGIIGIERTKTMDELSSLYKLALAFVNPTYEDNFPTVNIESLSSGTPVITYNTGGSAEAIDSNTGIVVDRGDVENLAKAVIKISKKYSSKQKELCRERAIKLFDGKKTYIEYLKLYNKLTNVNRGGYVICVSSVWYREKGFYDIIKLRALLPIDELIVMVGVTKDQITMLPIGILGIERTSNCIELAVLYSGADAFINPTYGDNFPTVNIEALSCGTPVITYKTGGSPEAIDGSTGIVVNQGDIEGLSNAVGHILASENKFNSFQCRTRIVQNFNAAKQYEKYFNIYNSVLK